ncbi:type II secretion system F family protein [Geodermatophilus marinus]|uniref:type II secretion system F family protein n=1 Tax=Geodermatophilus sp. LHW52908 TaxID=2303986 RepID=UPI000E3BE252|nr:type II secretion system F family protein [Geodermatophilus sp. LHW52908]RFU20632.1 secretion system protein F [Geodermatophilus sp. LHW52908]
MTGLQTATLAGMLIAGGLVLAVRALRPVPPSLVAALEQLAAEPTVRTAPAVTTSTRDRWDWLPGPVARALDGHLGVSDADLAIIGWTRAQLAGRKLTLALAGLLAPSLFGLVFVLLDVPVPFVLPVVVGLGIAVVGWFLPSAEAREAAEKARVEFRSNLESFLTLVAGERRARGSVEQALEEAAEISGSMPFVRMRRAIRRAALSGRKPWGELRDLGEELQVAELRNLADIAAVAADGASVYNTLLASARTLRHAELSDARTEANQVSERMSRPLALLVTGLTLFVLVPFMLRMFGISS